MQDIWSTNPGLALHVSSESVGHMAPYHTVLLTLLGLGLPGNTPHCCLHTLAHALPSAREATEYGTKNRGLGSNHSLALGSGPSYPVAMSHCHCQKWDHSFWVRVRMSNDAGSQETVLPLLILGSWLAYQPRQESGHSPHKASL